MNIHRFYPLQEPQPEEFDEAFIDSAFNLIKRFGTITQPGIVPATKLYALTYDLRWFSLMPEGLEFNIVQNGDFAFDVGPGMAFSRNTVASVGSPQDTANPVDLRMERVLITPADAAVTYNAANATATDVLGNATPKSTGCTAIPVLPLRIYYVYVKYLHCVDTLTNNPADPGNKYTLNAQTGQVQYTHWVDGYEIKTYINAESTDPDDIYIGMVTTGASYITAIDMSGRDYLAIPGVLVTSDVRGTLLPATYISGVTGTAISFTDHVNAVGDFTAVTRLNPHGVTIDVIPGLSDKFGIFSDSPQNFYTNGIVDTTSDVASNRPGPFWARTTGTYIVLNAPLTGQSLSIDKYTYDSDSIYYSEIYNGVDALVVQSTGGTLTCEFPLSPATVRASGYYLIYAERTTIADIAGLAIKALWCGIASDALLADILENPGATGRLSLATQYPIAVINFNVTSGFVAFTVDPQTRYAAAPFNCLDIRRYGTISEANISYDRRSYTDLTTEVPQTGNLARNNIIYSDHIKWIAQGPAMVVTTYPVVQAMVKKPGRIRRVTVFSDTIPTGGTGLGIDITKNGITNSIFSTYPVISAGRTGNAANYSGTPSTAVIMDITENAPIGADIGQISTTLNHVNPGDRLQLIIPEVGATGPGGDDLLVMIYIE